VIGNTERALGSIGLRKFHKKSLHKGIRTLNLNLTRRNV